MPNIFTVQAIFIAVSGRPYKSQPKEIREGLDLDDYKLAIRSDLRMGQYPIEFVNELGHEQLIMPAQIETVIFNVLAIRPEHSFQEPEYEKLRQQWQHDLQMTMPDGQEIIVDHKLAQDVVQKVEPIQPVEHGSASSTSLIPSSDQTVVYKYGGPRTPDPKVYVMSSEETQEMPRPSATEEDENERTMATKAVNRAANRATAAAAYERGSGRASGGARETRSGQRAARTGKLPRG